jgi:hypothetical protein
MASYLVVQASMLQIMLLSKTQQKVEFSLTNNICENKILRKNSTSPITLPIKSWNLVRIPESTASR